jgi:crotonobetainyl-CoA:carnitine CoA-transferase CaiB-like acyl-CoA transferase
VGGTAAVAFGAGSGTAAGSAPGGTGVGQAALEVTGATGHLVSRLPVEDTAIACVGAALLAAASLAASRNGGRPGSVRLDTGHVAAAVRSERYVRRGGEPVGAGFAPLSRFWRAADGWVRTHANYPWHRAALLRSLGVDDVACGDGDPDYGAAGGGARNYGAGNYGAGNYGAAGGEATRGRAGGNARDPGAADLGAADHGVAVAIGAVIETMPAVEVEARVVAAGGVAAAVRTHDDWRAGSPGQAVAHQRLIEGGQIGAAPPRRRPPGPLPASGLRVLDLTRVIAGPVCTRFLAALGADVLRLDPPHLPELPTQIYDSLLGKRSALLDARTTEGAARLHELLAQADVLVHGYRPHALSRYGLDPVTIAARYPGLVVASLSAWGSTGPWGSRRGFDSIVQAATGIAVAESPGAGRPGVLPCQLLDHGSGYLCAAAVLEALGRQAETGGTHQREVSLARTAHWLLSQPRVLAGAAAGATAGATVAGGDDGGAWLTTVESGYGPVTAVAPPGQLNGHGLSWPGPLTGYGSDRPQW